MSFTDALSRISDIQQQITALTTGTLPSATSTTGTADSSAAADATSSTSASGASAFSQALATAQGLGTTGTDDVTDTAGTDDVTDTADSGEALGAASSDASFDTAVGSTQGTNGGAALPSSAASLLTSDQQQFASALSADTGLNPGVVSAWLLAEESGSAADSRQAANNNDWLNIGYTDSGTVGAQDSVWSNPVSAATATAQWLQGQDSIPGYGTASSGVQSILQSVGQAPEAQISALQNSGWASSGYPDLDSLYAEVSA